MMAYTVWAAMILPAYSEKAFARCREPFEALVLKSNLSNVSLWTAGGLVFCYSEGSADDGYIHDVKNLFGNLFDFLPYPCRLMYDDTRIIEPDKAKIRHRVFMTHLHEGCEEEYKLRHDRLKAANAGNEPGADSNFTIWHTGGYIFGYDEILLSREHPATEDEKRETIFWETNMYEIMDWITDDTDWISGQKHDHIKRLL